MFRLASPLEVAPLPKSGVYHLILHLPRPVRIRAGALGALRLPAGYYTYTGRAMRGLHARLARHARREGKRLRWHIDYLLRSAQLEGIRIAPAPGPGEECRLARLLLAQAEAHAGAEAVPRRGFGASDCRCPAHLFYWGADPPEVCGGGWGRAVSFR